MIEREPVWRLEIGLRLRGESRPGSMYHRFGRLQAMAVRDQNGLSRLILVWDDKNDGREEDDDQRG